MNKWSRHLRSDTKGQACMYWEQAEPMDYGVVQLYVRDLRKGTISRKLVILSYCVALKVQFMCFMVHFILLL